MVDLSFLEQFTLGNPAKMRRYISMYLKMAPETFERMHQNIEDESWPELAVNAHSLKPQAELMGIEILKELLIDIENKVRSDQTEEVAVLFTKARSIHDDAEIFLQDYIHID